MLFYKANFAILNRRNHREIRFLNDSKYSRGAVFSLNDILFYGHPFVLIYNLRFYRFHIYARVFGT